MRGLLLIASQRAPYLRAGLAWPAAEPVDGDPRKLKVDVRDLDGPRFLELIQDPVLSMQASDDQGNFKPVVFVPALTAEACQLMIDSLAEELPPRVQAAPASGEDLTEQLHRQAGRIETFMAEQEALLEAITSRGWPTLEAFLEGYDRFKETLRVVIAIASAANGDAGSLDDVTIAGWLGDKLAALKAAEDARDAAKAELAEANAEGDELQKKVEALEAELADLKAEPKPRKGGAKT